MTNAAQSAGLPLQIAITTGEPAGVGPELTAQALAGAATHWPVAQFTVRGVARRARTRRGRRLERAAG
jgi:4-hydroxythreonine-4-phosphate dehydrogenase